MAAAEAALDAELAEAFPLFKEQCELAELQQADRLAETRAAVRKAESEENDARLQAAAADGTRAQYAEAADAEQARSLGCCWGAGWGEAG